jgi:single-strand DNA-binding protein
MNRAILHGNVGKDPEVKTIESGKKVARFSLATSEHSKDKDGNKTTQTTWHNIVAWERLAELCERHVTKGSQLIIEDRISNRSYVNKDGQTVYTSEIIASSLFFTGRKDEAKKDDNKPTEESFQSNGQFSKSGKTTEELIEDINGPAVQDEVSDLPF